MNILTKLLILFYLILYVSHLILGPYYINFLLNNKKIKFKTKNIIELLKKSVYITYVSLLFTIYFLIYPTTESFIIACLITLIALLSYIIIYNNSEYLYISIIDHTLLLVPFIFYYYLYKIDLNKYKYTNLSNFTILYLIFITLTYKNIYG